MKKILYSIFALSTIMFTATSCAEDTGTTTEVEDSNADETVNPNHIRGYGDREPGGAEPSSPEADQMYGFSTEEFSSRLSADLGVDTTIATEMVRVYYDRNRQLSEMQRAAKAEGEAQADLQRIDTETDQRIREILTPEQYRTYEQNRAQYNQMTQNNNGGATGAGNQTGQGNTGSGNQTTGQGTTGSGNQTTGQGTTGSGNQTTGQGNTGSGNQ